MVSLSGRAPAPPPTVRDALVRQLAVVTLVDETGVRGLVWSSDATGLMLAPAAGQPVEQWSPGGEWTPADGQLFVPAAQIKFVQLPGGTQ
jgi:hypothetical protein